MKTRHIHITGASGAGTTTLGRALADRLAVPQHDSDDYYWCPTNPPFREVRPAAERFTLMEAIFLGRSDWVLSGSIEGWGDPIAPLFDFIVFLDVPIDVRLERLRKRETRRFGHEAVSPGGWRHRETEDFIEWASHYEDGSREGRNRQRHEAWLKTQHCPLLRLDGDRPTAELVQEVLGALGERL